MSWNGAGAYLLNPLYSPEVNGTIIDALRYNGLTTDIATGISNTIAKDGQNVPTANLPMGGFKHTGAADGAGLGDYVTIRQLADTTTLGEGAARVWYKPTGGTARSLFTRNADALMLTDFGGIVADGTDQTAEIVAWLGTLAADASGYYIVPFNTSFVPADVLAAMPADGGVIFEDRSGLNYYNTAGNVAKRVGWLSRDKDTDDTAVIISSGHHPGLQFNNYNITGSGSGAARAQTVIYSAGDYTLGPAGYREQAEFTLRNATGNDWWEWNFNSMAPWVAVEAEYERWAYITAVTANVTYCLNAANIYVSSVTGTPSATAPTHTSGTANGWTWVRTAGAAVHTFDEYGRIRTNGGVSNTDALSLKQNSQDPATNMTVTVEATGASKPVLLVANPTNSAGTVVPMPIWKWDADTGYMSLFSSTGALELVGVSDAGGMNVGVFRKKSRLVSSVDTTPSVAGISRLYIDSASAITTLDDAQDEQEVELVFINTGASLVNSGSFTLVGGVNLTAPSLWSVVTMTKVPASISNRWIETSRNLK